MNGIKRKSDNLVMEKKKVAKKKKSRTPGREKR